jgi:hypothetical protein
VTADVTVLADWRRRHQGTTRARRLAVDSGHPCAGDRTGLTAGRELIRIGTGRAAHVVELYMNVPATAPSSRARRPDGTRLGAHTSVFTYCGRAAPAADTTHAATGTPVCRRCATRLLAIHRHGAT